MCGRFSTSNIPTSIISSLNVSADKFEPKREVYPSDEVTVVFRAKINEAAKMRWGWHRDFSKRPLINTRGLEAWNKKTWRHALQHQRCIIPASAFYEWNENQPKGKRDKYKISPTDTDGFAIGGLYEINEMGEMLMSILTTLPNSKMTTIHHRMPVIIVSDQFDNWFTSNNKTEIEGMMQPLHNESIKIEQVSRQN